MVGRTQRFEGVVVSGVAHVDAPIRVTSDEIEAQLAGTMARLRLTPGLLAGLAGILERRFWEPGIRPSDAATAAGERLLDSVPIDRAEVGALINTSVDRDFVEPSTACIVHANLGLAPEAVNFDVGNACLGFINGMALVAAMIERGDVDHGLVVDAEGSRYVTERTVARLADPDCDKKTFHDSFATLTLGSGAAAMLLSRADLVEGGHPLTGLLSRAATQHNGLCRGQIDDMRTDTRGLMTAGIALAKETYKEAADAFDWSDESVAHHVIHQVSRVHTRTLTDALTLDADKVPLLFPYFGNIGPAGIAITLSKEAEADRLTSGDRISLMGIGSGLNCAMADLAW